jgi:raffinose/stachyose/melibiose transport system substrate-binding protein
MREKITTILGFTLLAVCFAVSLGRIAISHFASSSGSEGGKITIRLAHWQLEDGARKAFDRVAAEYEKLHPDVKIMQIPIPDRIYTNWLITQLVGGTAPDLIQIGTGGAINEERLARYFYPLSERIETPNPYNKGTELEQVALRDTFLDGMEGGHNGSLLEYYSVPLSGFTLRMFYNLDLLKQVTGRENLPRTYAELLELCRQIQAYAARTGKSIIPIAGSKYNAPLLNRALFSSQSGHLIDELKPPGLREFYVYMPFLERRFLEGAWDLKSPQVQSGLELVGEISRYMQPGFTQLGRDDAMFYFVQGNAVMICSGTWDATSIRSQAMFPVGVSTIPFPLPGDAQYGKFSHGRPPESGTTAVSIGLFRGSRHPEVAWDFLLFLSSQRMNQLWADTSEWIPAVLGVKTSAANRDFQPLLEGNLAGFDLTDFGPDAKRVYENNLNKLFGPGGTALKFAEAIQPDFKRALQSDASRSYQMRRTNSQRIDSVMGALAWQALNDPAKAKKLDLLLQAASAGDESLYGSLATLEAAGKGN